eukprot:Clim_evm1s54 gene=Clim_evmTU1s54
MRAGVFTTTLVALLATTVSAQDDGSPCPYDSACQCLSVEGGVLTKCVEGLRYFPEIEADTVILELPRVQFDFIDSTMINRAPLLRELKMIGTNNGRGGITTIFPDSFTNASNLKRINLGYNGITSLPDNVFLGATSLETLELWINEIADISSAAFNGLDNLNTIELNGNQLTNIEDFTFGNYTPSLTYLDLSNNNLESVDELAFEGTNPDLSTVIFSQPAGVVTMDCCFATGFLNTPESVQDGVGRTTLGVCQDAAGNAIDLTKAYNQAGCEDILTPRPPLSTTPDNPSTDPNPTTTSDDVSPTSDGPLTQTLKVYVTVSPTEFSSMYADNLKQAVADAMGNGVQPSDVRLLEIEDIDSGSAVTIAVANPNSGGFYAATTVEAALKSADESGALDSTVGTEVSLTSPDNGGNSDTSTGGDSDNTETIAIAVSVVGAVVVVSGIVAGAVYYKRRKASHTFTTDNAKDDVEATAYTDNMSASMSAITPRSTMPDEYTLSAQS